MTIMGRAFDLDPQQVERALEGELPEPIQEHFVVISGRRWPPKQVLALVTGLDRADFTTHQARRALTRLGFTAARAIHRGHPGHPAPRPQHGVQAPGQRQPLAEALRPFVGQWVAVRGEEVLVAASSPAEVVSWLAQHQQQAESMFRVPAAESEIGGAAPL
jgi:siderophore synthetase component